MPFVTLLGAIAVLASAQVASDDSDLVSCEAGTSLNVFKTDIYKEREPPTVHAIYEHPECAPQIVALEASWKSEDRSNIQGLLEQKCSSLEGYRLKKGAFCSVGRKSCVAGHWEKIDIYGAISEYYDRQRELKDSREEKLDQLLESKQCKLGVSRVEFTRPSAQPSPPAKKGDSNQDALLACGGPDDCPPGMACEGRVCTVPAASSTKASAAKKGGPRFNDPTRKEDELKFDDPSKNVPGPDWNKP